MREKQKQTVAGIKFEMEKLKENNQDPELMGHLDKLNTFLEENNINVSVLVMIHKLLSCLNENNPTGANEQLAQFVNAFEASKKNNNILLALKDLSLILASICLIATFSLFVSAVILFPPAAFIAIPCAIAFTLFSMFYLFSDTIPKEKMEKYADTKEKIKYHSDHIVSFFTDKKLQQNQEEQGLDEKLSNLFM